MRPTLGILFVLSIFLSCVEDTPQYTISTTVDPAEGGSISPASGTQDEGSQLSFEATANDGYHFERWSGALTGTTNPQAHTLTQDVSVTAHFALTDTTPPVITLNSLSQLINQGDTYTPPIVTATDNIDGDLSDSIVIGGDTVDTNTLGTYKVTYDVTDAAGNNAEQLIHTVTVAQNPNGDDDGDGVINFDDQCPNTPADTIVDDTGCEDTTPPVISMDRDSQVILVGNDYVPPTVTATDNVDGDLTESIVIGGDTVDTNTLGTYKVTYDVTDSSGNTATATHTITVTDNPNADDDGDGVSNENDHCANTPADTIVDDTGCEDTTPPVISVAAEQTIEIGVDTYSPPTVTVTDDFDSGLTHTQEGDTVDDTTLGTYVVTYTATDAAGNTTTATHTVTVVDTTAPVIDVVAEQTLEIGIDNYTEPTVTVTDNSGETLTATKEGDTVDDTTLGTYVVTYNATDSSGNAATEATHTVTVVNTLPTVPLLTDYSGKTRPLNGSLTWTASTDPDGDDDLITYDIVIHQGGNEVTYATGLTTTEYAYTLSANTTYTWQVTAKDGMGSSTASDEGTFTTNLLADKVMDTPGENPIAEGTIDLNEANFRSVVFKDPITDDNLFEFVGNSNGITNYAPTAERSKNYTMTMFKDGATEGIVLTEANASLNISGTVNPRFTMFLDSFVAEQNGQTSELFGEDYFIAVTTAVIGNSPSERFIGTKGTPIIYSADEVATLSENGTTFVLTQTATSETTDVVIDQAATAEEIGEAIKAAAGTFTIYVQPEVQDDGSLHIFADEAFTISAN